MKDLRGIVLRRGWGGRGFGVSELQKWGSNTRWRESIYNLGVADESLYICAP